MGNNWSIMAFFSQSQWLYYLMSQRLVSPGYETNLGIATHILSHEVLINTGSLCFRHELQQAYVLPVRTVDVHFNDFNWTIINHHQGVQPEISEVRPFHSVLKVKDQTKQRQYNWPSHNGIPPYFVGETLTCLHWSFALTHWGQMTHICVSDLTSIGSNNGLSPGRRQAISEPMLE